MPISGKILELLHSEPMTVAQLAERFGVTRNAVVVQLNKLEAAGLVERSAPHRAGQVGKPATVYSAAAGHEDKNSLAYRPFAELLSGTLVERMKPKQREELYRQMGAAMAAHVDTSELKTFDEKIAAARVVADSLGAATHMEVTDGICTIRSFTCPIAAVVRKDPCACLSLEEFFHRVTGCPVREACDRDGKLLCKFEIEL